MRLHSLSVRRSRVGPGCPISKGDVTPDSSGALRDLEEALVHSYDKGDRVMATVAFDRGATVLASLGHPEQAAVLAGVAMATPLASLSIVPPIERADRDAALAQLRTAVGDTSYDAAVARGSAMSLDAAVDYAISELRRLELDARDRPTDEQHLGPATRLKQVRRGVAPRCSKEGPIGFERFPLTEITRITPVQRNGGRETWRATAFSTPGPHRHLPIWAAPRRCLSSTDESAARAES
jgi:hypothetical protein